MPNPDALDYNAALIQLVQLRYENRAVDTDMTLEIEKLERRIYAYLDANAKDAAADDTD